MGDGRQRGSRSVACGQRATRNCALSARLRRCEHNERARHGSTTGGIGRAPSLRRKRKTLTSSPPRARSIPMTSGSSGRTETCRLCAPVTRSESRKWASEPRGGSPRTRTLNQSESSPYFSSHSAMTALLEYLHSRESMHRESQHLRSAPKHALWNAPLLRVGFPKMNHIGSPSVPPLRQPRIFSRGLPTPHQACKTRSNARRAGRRMSQKVYGFPAARRRLPVIK